MKNFIKKLVTSGCIIASAMLINPVLPHLSFDNAMAASTPSTVEIQQDLQQHWSEVESLQSEYSAIKSKSALELTRINNQIESLKRAVTTASKRSAERLEARTRLTELITARHIGEYEREQACRRIIADIITSVLKVEADLEEMERVYGTKKNKEAMQWVKTTINLIGQMVKEVQVENRSFSKGILDNADPLLVAKIKTSRAFFDSTSKIVLDSLNRSVEQKDYSVGNRLLNAFKTRGAFETLRAQKMSNTSHHEQILMVLKANAEMQAAAIIARLMDKTIGGITEEINANFDSSGDNAKFREDWDLVKLTEPDI